MIYQQVPPQMLPTQQSHLYQTCQTPPSTHQSAQMQTAALHLTSQLNNLKVQLKKKKSHQSKNLKKPTQQQQLNQQLNFNQNCTWPVVFITSFHSVKDLNKHLKDNNTL